MNKHEKIIHALADYSEPNSLMIADQESFDEKILSELGISVREIKFSMGPTFSSYQIFPEIKPGIASRLRHLEDDLALRLNNLNIRILQPELGKFVTSTPSFRIEIPNRNRKIVGLRCALMSKRYKDSVAELPVSFGMDVNKEIYIQDLAQMPHLLLAGAAGSGKSVFLHTIIASLIYAKSPEDVCFVLIDPKEIEFEIYRKFIEPYTFQMDGIDNPVMTSFDDILKALQSLKSEMNRRYTVLNENHAQNISEYNQKTVEKMPRIVVIIDEFADITIANKAVEGLIITLSTLGSAVGIHLIISTQRPSPQVITGLLRANIDRRVGFRVSTIRDSRIIIDQSGAEKLVGNGDLLYNSGSGLIRLQGHFIEWEVEIERYLNAIVSRDSKKHKLYR